RITRSSSYIVQELEARRAWDDTMAYHYSKLAEHGLATLNTSAYDNLRSVGFDLISNDSIRIALTSLHGITYNRFVQFERELAADNQSMVITPVFLKRIRMTGPWNRAEPIDLDRLYDDIEFIEMARWKATTMGFLAQLYEGAIISTSDLMRMIEQELDKKE
ncbi:MAG: hypothetical protein KDB88_12040, partial [Flavobacteriales bacterium]|nr:hypothetical protein [Flavobacteriales bacterium]